MNQQELEQQIRAQARRIQQLEKEAQIEAALAKVRSRTMGMQKSEELEMVIQVLFKQFVQLKIFVQHTGFIIDYKKRDDMLIWLADEHAVFPQISIPYFSSPHWNSFLEAKEKGRDLFTNHLNFREKNLFYQQLFTYIPDLTEEVKEHYLQCPGLAISTVLLDNIGLYIENFQGIPYSDHENSILLRFGKVFQQTYTRFLDLKKAEGQAREAQIEAALERVRAKSMAMQKSEDLADLSLELVQQVQHLGIETWFCAFNIQDDKKACGLEWGSNGQGVFPKYSTPREGIFLEYYHEGQSGVSLFVREIDENECPAHYEYLCTLPGVGEQLLKMKESGIPFPTSQIDHVAFFKYGYILFITYEPVPESHHIFERFAKVFEQSYTRFLDLQKAEAQAREAEIEAALEKVRSSSLSVTKVDEFNEVVKIVFQKLSEFQIPISSVTIGTFKKDSKDIVIFGCGEIEAGLVTMKFNVPYFPNAFINDTLKERSKSPSGYYSKVYSEEDKNTYYNHVFEHTELKILPEHLKDTIRQSKSYGISAAYALHSIIMVNDFEGNLLDKAQSKILIRFSRVFEQAYARFLDLKNAEASARASQIEAALERVRSTSLSMQKTQDLQQVVDAVFAEMHALEIGLDHTAIVTLIDDSKDYNVWVGSADENFTTFSRIPYNDWTQVQRDYNQMIASRPTLLVKKYEGEIKKEYSQYLFSQTGFKDNTPEKELRLMRDGASFTTSIAMQQHTGIQIVSYAAWTFSDRDHDVLQRFANVFEQAYIRFMDIQKAEIQAKKILLERDKLEQTLGELKSAQAQLIQSEKMASLGELTAGIAHEIQNPLNFVNNFSDVSSELLDEVREELQNGELGEAQEIINSLKENLTKINHHGQRASSIVKGMLDHSRTSSDEKVPTDINQLCNEYLRLAYHGMRAKDKSFNVKYDTDFQENIPPINIVPQDIGRVILNLVNNAFQACQEEAEAKAKGPTAEPGVSSVASAKKDKQINKSTNKQIMGMVRISSKHIDDAIQITVSDNGPGIPNDIKDKIFQPFFTTKATGQGTGLGLSLSYDMVTKGHGGTLEVESEEGLGTKFVIKLPLDSK